MLLSEVFSSEGHNSRKKQTHERRKRTSIVLDAGEASGASYTIAALSAVLAQIFFLLGLDDDR